MKELGYVYIIGNSSRSVLYTGVTSNLERRVYQHRHKMVDGFSKRYRCTDLLWYEQGESIVAAIEREKEIKRLSRAGKMRLISYGNPEFMDLSVGLFGASS